MHKNFLKIAFILGAVAVVLGAFGAHGLKKLVSPEAVNTFDTGVRYLFYHVFALAITAILFEKYPGKPLLWAARFFLIGILLFSGSLFLLTALKATNTVGLSGIGAITPIGGLFFIAGWVSLVTATKGK